MARAKATAQSPVVGKIVGNAKDIHDRIVGGRKPSMKFPLRALSNVRYAAKKGHFEMLGKKKERTLTVSTVKSFAQTLRMVSLSKTLIETGDYATKRDAYYQTKNWDDARCDDQVESDTWPVSWSWSTETRSRARSRRSTARSLAPPSSGRSPSTTSTTSWTSTSRRS